MRLAIALSRSRTVPVVAAIDDGVYPVDSDAEASTPKIRGDSRFCTEKRKTLKISFAGYEAHFGKRRIFFLRNIKFTSAKCAISV